MTTGAASAGGRRTPSSSRSSATATPSWQFFAGEIYAAVADLSADLRDTVALVDVAGMSHADAARVLRVPRATVMTRLHRARSRVAGALAQAA